MPKVSIIVLNWNGKKFLKNCLDSLLKITYPSFEIIVVDNNSKDDSQEFVKKNYQKVVLIENKENYGFAKGNNIGYKRAAGKYILFLNNDTVVTPNFLQPLVDIFENNSLAGCIQPQIRLVENKKVLDGIGAFLTSTGFLYHFGYLKDRRKEEYARQIKIFSVKGACMFIKRKTIEKVGLFDDDFFIFFEETDLCFRIWLSGHTVLYEPNSIIYHIGAGDTASSDSYSYDRRMYLSLRNTLCSYLKNFGTRNMFTILPIFVLLNLSLALYWLITLKMNLAIIIVRAFLWNIKNAKKTMKKREKVQYKIRKVSDSMLNNQVIRNPSLSYYLYLFAGKLDVYKDR